jgi:hypothetical protein
MVLTKLFEYLLQPVFSYVIFPITKIAVNTMEIIVFALLSPSTPFFVFWFSIIFIPIIFLSYYNLPFNNAAIVIDRVERLGKEKFRESESPEDTEELRLLDELYGRHDFLKHLYLLPPSRLGIAVNSLQAWRRIWSTSIATFALRIIVAGWIIAVSVWDSVRGQKGRYCRHASIGCKCFTANFQIPGARTYEEVVQTELTVRSNMLTRERDKVIEENGKLQQKVKELADHREHCKETHQAFRQHDLNLEKVDNLQAERDRLSEDNRRLNAKLAEMGRNDVPRTVERLQDAYVSARDNHRKHTDSLTAALTDSQVQLGSLKDEIRRLKNDLETTRHGKLLSINQRLEKDISKLGMQLFDSSRRHAKEIQLKDEQIQNESLRLLLRLDDGAQARLRQLESLLRKRDKDLAICIAARDRFEKDANERAEEIKHIKEERIRSEPVHLEGLLKDAYKEIAEKEEELSKLEFFSRAENDVEAVERQCEERKAELQAMIDDREREISVFHAQIDVAWDSLDWPADKFENRDRYTAFVDGACLEIRRLQDDIWKMQYQIRQVGRQFDIQGLDIELQSMRDADNKYRNEALGLRRSLEESERTVEELEAELDRLHGIEEVLLRYEREAQMNTQDLPLERSPPRRPSGWRPYRRHVPITRNPDDRSPIAGDDQDDTSSSPSEEDADVSRNNLVHYTKPKAFDMEGWDLNPTATHFLSTTRAGRVIVYDGVSAILALLESIRSQKPHNPLGQTSELALLQVFEAELGEPPDTGRAYNEYQVALALCRLSNGHLFLETVRKTRGSFNEADAYTSRSVAGLSLPKNGQLPKPIYIFLQGWDTWQSMRPVDSQGDDPQGDDPQGDDDQLPQSRTAHEWDGPNSFQPPPGYEIDTGTSSTYVSPDEFGKLVRRTNVSSINALLSSIRSQYPDSPIGSASPDILHKRLVELFPIHTGEYGIAHLQTLLSDSTHRPLYALRMVEPRLDGQAGYTSTIEILGSPANPETRPEILIYHTAHEPNAPWQGITVKKEVEAPVQPFPTYHELVKYDLNRNFDITGWRVIFNHDPEVDRFTDLARALSGSYTSQYIAYNGAIHGRFPYPGWRDALAQEVPSVDALGHRISIEHNALQKILHHETSNSVRLIRVQSVVENGVKSHCRFSLKSCAPDVMPSICTDVYMFVDHSERWQSMRREVEIVQEESLRPIEPFQPQPIQPQQPIQPFQSQPIPPIQPFQPIQPFPPVQPNQQQQPQPQLQPYQQQQGQYDEEEDEII